MSTKTMFLRMKKKRNAILQGLKNDLATCSCTKQGKYSSSDSRHTCHVESNESSPFYLFVNYLRKPSHPAWLTWYKLFKMCYSRYNSTKT